MEVTIRCESEMKKIINARERKRQREEKEEKERERMGGRKREMLVASLT